MICILSIMRFEIQFSWICYYLAVLLVAVNGHLLRFSADDQTLKLTIDRTAGTYQLSVGGVEWLKSGPAFFTSGGTTYNSSAGGGLIFKKWFTDFGVDILGEWNSTSFIYTIPPAIDVVVTFKEYAAIPGVILFGQHFVSAILGSSVGKKDGACTGFPSFTVDGKKQKFGRRHHSASSLGYLAYGGIMFGDTGKNIGLWDSDAARYMESGRDSGPLVLFNQQGDAIVVSAFSQFMAVSAAYTASSDGSMNAAWGILGTAKHIPADFSVWTIASHSSRGINMAMWKWGAVLRYHYKRGTEYRDADITNNYIGYYTDNGAYYYYTPELGFNYEKTILDVKAYTDKLGVPYRYVQYDSWFYPKGPDEGVTEWVSMPSIFPHGMQYLWNQTGWLSVAHNRWWSPKTVYAKQNGGKYNFIIDDNVGKAIPDDPKFWEDLLRESRKWGLIVYEQDWLNDQFDDMEETLSDVTLGRRWLLQMGNGARKNGLTIQYCMSPSRHALQSLEIPVVSQARVSNDYEPGDATNRNWRIGISSIFAHVLGVAPFKDNFWTTTTQTGNMYNKSEPYPELESLIATLSTGPVAPADKIGCSDYTLIMRSCNADGLILKPSRPATAIDKQILQKSLNQFSGEVWSTYSHISGWIFGIVFGANFGPTDKMVISPTDAGFGHNFHNSVVYSWYNVGSRTDYNEASPLALDSRCGKKPFCLYIVSPKMFISLPYNYVVILLGELDKWVPISPQRVINIDVVVADVLVELQGGFYEKITFHYVKDYSLLSAVCDMGGSGRALLRIASGVCTSV